MNDALASGNDLGTAVEVRLAERWADFTKALAIYPETNNRVRLNLEALQTAIGDANAAAERAVTVVFQEKHIEFGGQKHEFHDRSSLAWLRDRLDHAGLAGAQFHTGVEEATLIAFSKRLLENFLRKDANPSFEDLWPDTYDGILLMDRRFDGTFGRAGRGGSGGGGSGDGAGSVDGGGAGSGDERGDGDGTGIGDDGGDGGGGGGVGGGFGVGTGVGGGGFHRAGAREEGLPLESGEFIAGLMTDPEVAERLDTLHDLAKTGFVRDLDAEVRATDLLKRIIEELSAEAVQDRGTLVRSVCKTMDALAKHITEDTSAYGFKEQGVYLDLLQQVSRAHFSREGADLERLKPEHGKGDAPTAGGGRKRDALITDDVELLLSEVEDLPDRLQVDLVRDGAESSLEVLSVLLHYLVHLDHPERVRGLFSTLTTMLESPGADELAVLRGYFETVTDEAVRERATSALMSFFARIERPELLRVCGLLESENVLMSFPKHFPIYLAALDTNVANDLAELDSVCEALGAERLFAARGILRQGFAQLPDAKVSSLLNRPKKERLPLVHLLLTLRPDPDLYGGMSFLRSLDLPEPEAFLLHQFPDPKWLTADYLTGLIDRHLDRLSPEELSDRIADVLCNHIRGTHKGGARSKARLDSIRSLARFPAPRGWHMLQELAKTRWGWFGGKEPLAVRRLARSISKHYRTA